MPFPQLRRPALPVLVVLTSVLACGEQNGPVDPATTETVPEGAEADLATPLKVILGEPIAACEGGSPAVAILVEPALAEGVTPAVTQFANDLCAAGYTATAVSPSFSTPVELRRTLRRWYRHSRRQLVGVVLVGDFPRAYQFVRMVFANPSIPPLEEEVISYQFYSDLDGRFRSSAGYVSPGGHAYSYDVHQGRVDWEIWVGVVPRESSDPAASAAAMNRYFSRNHAYRTGASPYPLPRRFLLVTEHRSAGTQAEHDQAMSDLRTGVYSWTPWSAAADALIYFDSPVAGLSVEQGYDALETGAADFFAGAAHGAWWSHGQLDLAWARTGEVRTAFFWSDGCAVADLDHPDNFLTAVLYNPNSLVVAAKGTTNDSGGLGTNEDGFYGHNIASRMDAGHGLGDAVVAHVNTPLVDPWADDREFHFATVVLLGDPTLGVGAPAASP